MATNQYTNPGEEKIDLDPDNDGGDTPDLGNDIEGEDELVELADDGSEAGKGGQGSNTVPHSRFNEVNERAKAAEALAQREREERIRLEERLRALEGRGTEQPAAPAAQDPAFDLKAKIKERNAALLEGDDDKVAEIEAELEERRTAEAEARAIARMEQNQSANALQQTAAAVVEAYPFLDSTSADADKEAIAEVKEWRDYYIAKGMAPHKALDSAVKRLKSDLDAKLGTGGDSTAGKTPEQVAAEKKAAAVARNAGAANRQPPLPGGLSNGATPTMIDPMKIDADEWAKLPEKERDKLLV